MCELFIRLGLLFHNLVAPAEASQHMTATPPRVGYLLKILVFLYYRLVFLSLMFRYANYPLSKCEYISGTDV